MSQPLRELLSPKRSWVWGPSQREACTKVKEELARPTVLALYNPQAQLKISADASSFGLGAVLLQQMGNKDWKPVAYASRSMSETEKRYAQIEKEALTATWACEKFNNYILGSKFLIESDHKPLIPLLSSKGLDNLPPRIIRFCLRMDKYDYTIRYVAGKELYTADTLSRAPSPIEGGSQVTCSLLTRALLELCSLFFNCFFLPNDGFCFFQRQFCIHLQFLGEACISDAYD